MRARSTFSVVAQFLHYSPVRFRLVNTSQSADIGPMPLPPVPYLVMGEGGVGEREANTRCTQGCASGGKARTRPSMVAALELGLPGSYFIDTLKGLAVRV